MALTGAERQRRYRATEKGRAKEAAYKADWRHRLSKTQWQRRRRNEADQAKLDALIERSAGGTTDGE